MCIDPFDVASHLDGALMNIVTAKLASPNATVDDTFSIGQSNMKAFKGGRPGSFDNKLGKLVVTVDSKKKHIIVGQERVFDQELIYACHWSFGQFPRSQL